MANGKLSELQMEWDRAKERSKQLEMKLNLNQGLVRNQVSIIQSVQHTSLQACFLIVKFIDSAHYNAMGNSSRNASCSGMNLWYHNDSIF